MNRINSINTELIKGIIGRQEVIEYSKNNFKDFNINEDTVLISIRYPDDELIDKSIQEQFKDVLNVSFWDTEDNYDENIKPIDNKIGGKIKNFILNHKNDNFLIHCNAGKSRSSGVGLAVLCLIKHNGDKYEFSISPNPITVYTRYTPNRKVFETIIES